ncbi:hypothetical protein K438DRAFT_2011678 [Mycena galopus ATCC 62051]|nr:hypothetical protein K438DRAFT_2011678 [Mycena galopus ATCC 62051]
MRTLTDIHLLRMHAGTNTNLCARTHWSLYCIHKRTRLQGPTPRIHIASMTQYTSIKFRMQPCSTSSAYGAQWQDISALELTPPSHTLSHTHGHTLTSLHPLRILRICTPTLLHPHPASSPCGLTHVPRALDLQ